MPCMASIRKHIWANGRTVTWQVMWRENGKQTSATLVDEKTARAFKTYLESVGSAAAWEWLEKASNSTEPPKLVTLDEHMEHYIGHLTGITEGTRAEYRRLYARTWSRRPDGTPLLGALPVDAINRDQIAAAVNTLQARGLAAKSIANAHGLLYAALDAAVEAGLIAKNPSRHIRLPRTDDGEDDEITYLEQAEFARLYGELPGHWRPLVLTLVGTGARWGEATAWRVRDVSLAKATIRVARAWKRVPGGWELGPPKTRKSRRTITLPPELVDTLRPLVEGRAPDEWLFTSARGDSPVHHANFRQRVWLPAIARAQRCDEHADAAAPCGCPGTLTRAPRIHDLRHTHVSWLIAAGVPLPAIQRRLGHESIQTTVDVYGDLIPDVQRQAALAASTSLAAVTTAQLVAG